MKNIAFTLFFAFFASFLLAQAPQAINYQAVARDNAGSPITNQAVGVRFSILQGSADGAAVYTETHQVTTNPLGLLNLQIGRGTPVSGAFSRVDWSAQPYFLKVEIDPAGGTNYRPLGPPSEMLSVPYALAAQKVEQESQTLSLEGNRLTISQGNTVELNSAVAACDVLEDCSDLIAEVLENGKVNRVYDPGIFGGIRQLNIVPPEFVAQEQPLFVL